jgi:virginiamycin B lyase
MMARISLLTLLLALAGCGQNAHLPAVPLDAVRARVQTAPPVTVEMRVVIGGTHRHRTRNRGARYVSVSTNGVLVQIYPHGASRTPGNLIAQVAADVSSGARDCAGKAGAPRTCTVPVVLPPTGTGGDDVVVAGYDRAPNGASIPPSAHLLEFGTLLGQSIGIGRANSLEVFLGGIVASLGGNPPFASLPADASRHALAIAIDPEDFGNDPITAGTKDPLANPVAVSITESGGSGHMLLSVNGGTPSAHVIAKHTTDDVEVQYDGGGSPGYAASVTLSAQPFDGFGGATESLTVAALILTGSNNDYVPGALHLRGNGDIVTIFGGETDAPNTTVYGGSTSNCSAIADATMPVQRSSGLATMTVFARPTASSGGCTVSFTDGISTVALAVTNAYSGVLGTPVIAEIPLPANAVPEGITAGPDEAMWFGDNYSHSLGQIANSAYGTLVTEYALSNTLGIDPQDVATGPDGNLWWSDNVTNTVGNVTTSGEARYWIEQDQHGSAAGPSGIVAGPGSPSSQRMWFGELYTAAIALQSTDGNYNSSFALPASSLPAYPEEITLGPDGNLWFTEPCRGKIGKITPSGTASEFTVPSSPSRPGGITAGADGAIWFTDSGQNAIGRIPIDATSGSQIALHGTGITGSGLFHITVGPDGALWFPEQTAPSSGPLNGKSVVGRLDPSTGTIGEYAAPTSNSAPFGVAAGPDGAIWFTEHTAANAGRIAIATSASLRPRAKRHRGLH